MVERIGNYDIISEIGRGGMGRVYRAHDPAVGRDVAIKVLTEEADPDLLGRFRSEASTTANLRHNNIVTLFGYGEHEGMPYLVMELLEGENLQTIIEQRQPLSLLQKVTIMTKVAEGLHAAHQSGVIHRDVKPANIMILRDGTVKIMDFGIARVTSRETVRRTRQGFLVGTISYMAPEQFQTAGEADICGDIFAFGDVYYELLTGVHPFAANDPATIMFKITAVEPQSIRELVPDCPESLEFAVLRALSKDRVMRYQSLEDLLFDTEPVLLDLKRRRAHDLAIEAKGLVDAEDFKAAQNKIREVLELEPTNRDARQLRELLNQRVQHEAIKGRVEVLVRDAEERLNQRRWAEAVERLESAVKINKTDTHVQSRLSEARARLEANRQAQRLVMEAKQAAQQGDLTASHRLVSSAIAAEPDNREAIVFEAHVRRQLSARRLQIAMQAAQQHLAEKRFPEAFKALDVAEKEAPGSPEVEELRNRVAKERAEDKRRRESDAFERELARVRDEIKAGRLPEASQLAGQMKAADSSAERRLAELKTQIEVTRRTDAVRSLSREVSDLAREQKFDAALECVARGLKQYTGEASLERLRQEISTLKSQAEVARRAEAVRALAREVSDLAREQKFDAALECVARGLKQYSGESSLERLRQEISARKAEKDAEDAIRDARDRARGHIQAGRFEQAADVVARALARYPGSAEMTELRDAISRERSTRDYSQALAQVLDQARARLAGSSPAEAIALLEAAAPRYGREPAVIELLASARAAQAVEEERIFVQGTLARIESFERLHQWSRALAEAEAALKRYPDQKDFLDRAIGLHEELVREEHALALKRRLAQLEGSLAAGDWRAAAKALATARAEYPEEAAFANLVGRVEQATYRGELAETVSRIRHQLSTASVAEAGRLLDSSQVRFGNEPSWLEIRDSVQLHENYEDRLRVAEDYRRQGNLEEAEAVVWALIAGSALDDRAERLSATIADEKSRRDRSAAIADARKSVQALIDRGNLPEAIEELRSSTIRFPEDPSLFTELRRVEELLRISLLEAEQRVRYEAIQKARNDVTQMLQVGNLAGAIAYLRQLRATYPEDLSIADDLRRAEERQVSERVEAERAARRAALQEARDQVNALLLAGDTSPAIDRLKQMVKQFPEDQTLEGELRKARELEKTLLQQRKREEAERKEADRRNKERLKAEEAQRRKDSAEAERQKEAERKKEAERRRQEEDQRQRDVPPPPLPPVRVPTQVQVAPRLYQPTQVMPAPVALATPPPEPAEVPQQPKPLYLNPIVIAAAVVALAGGGYLTFRPSPVKTTTASVQWNAAPTELSFSWQTGSANPGPQQLALGDGEAAFQASSKEPWITVTPAEGSRLAPITVIANPKGLKAGTYDGSIRIIAAGKEATVPVHLEVLGAAALILQPSSLSFTYRDGGTLPSPQRITASTAGAALAVSVPPQENWLQAVSSGGSVTVSVRPNQMQVGDHRTNIRIARAGNGDARTIPVLLRIERAAGFEVTSPTSTGQAKMLRWSGSLKAGESLTLQGSSATTGQITSGSLPSEPFTVDGVGSGLTIAERPVKANGYRLKIQNTGSEEESSIIVRYRTSK